MIIFSLSTVCGSSTPHTRQFLITAFCNAQGGERGLSWHTLTQESLNPPGFRRGDLINTQLSTKLGKQGQAGPWPRTWHRAAPPARATPAAQYTAVTSKPGAFCKSAQCTRSPARLCEHHAQTPSKPSRAAVGPAHSSTAGPAAGEVPGFQPCPGGDPG